MFRQNDFHSVLSPNWIVLDSASTVSTMSNHELVTDIEWSNEKLHLLTGGGPMTLEIKAKFFGMDVWFDPNGVANILSLGVVANSFHVVFDSGMEDAFYVKVSKDVLWKFERFGSGLYYFDVAKYRNANNRTVTNYSFITTVQSNKEKYHRREVELADRALEVYTRLNRPSRQMFEHILTSNQLRNCPVTVEDARRAFKIYGHDVATLKGKTVKRKNIPASTLVTTSLPLSILENHANVTLCIDFFFVQGIAFFHSISRKINFRTVSKVENRKKETMLREIKIIRGLYEHRGFNVFEIKGDLEFQCLENSLLPTLFDPVAADDHVGEIERSNRTVKADLRTMTQSLPFTRWTRLMIEEAVRTVIRARNQFASHDGISTSLSPLTIVTGAPPPDYNKMSLEFGTYVQVFNDNDPTNTMAPRTTGAIALSSLGNSKGDYSFMSLDTGQKLIRHQWTALPMPSSVINQVTQLAKREGQPLLKDKCLLFEKRPGVPIPLNDLNEEAYFDLFFKDEGEDDLFDPLLKQE